MRRIAVLLWALVFAIGARADTGTPATCLVSFPAQRHNQDNIFSPRQEVDLGDAIAESALLDLRILAENDPTLDRIMKRLAASAPLRDLHIRTFIVEVPQASALVTPGGRVYVSRALIQLTQNEDELAGIIAHEFGHILAHQYAIRVSRLMKSTMGVTSVGDRRDIFDKYHRMVESLWKKPVAVSLYDLTHPEPIMEQDEYEADRLGLDVQAAAGYDPTAPIRAFDRLAETKGKTGNFFSNLLNYTPDGKRLGLMLKNVPLGCPSVPLQGSAEFLEWRARVLGNTTIHFPESLEGVLSRRMLSPPLAGGLRQLRFSRDGKYVLTQDRSGINVLSTEPLTVLFHVPAGNASRAELTPDGRDIVFVRSGTHIERWNLASRTRTEFAEMPLRGPCIAERLSPDGRFLVCLNSEWTLQLIDTSSGAPILKRKNFEAVSVAESLSTSFAIPRRANEYFEDFWQAPDLGALEASMLDFPRENQSFVESSRQSIALELSLERDLTEQAAMDFSPDGRFFLAVPEKYPGPVLAWDLLNNAAVHVGGALKKLNGFPYYHFTFVAGDRVLISPKVQDVKSDLMVTARLVAFPTGKTIAKVTVPAGRVTRASDSGFAIIHPSRPNLGLTAPGFQRSIASVGAYGVQLTTGAVVRNSSPGFDILRDRYVTDNAAGDVELRSQAGNGLLVSAQLPRAELGGIRAAALSGDMSRLLISSQSRAGVWNLSSGEALMRFGPVNGGSFDTRGRLLLDIPETDNQKRRMVDLDTESGGIDSGPEITSALAKQVGPYLVVVRTKDGRPPVFALDTRAYQDIIFDVLDARTMKPSWSRTFPNEAPLFFFDPSGRYCLFIWRGHADRVQHDPELRKRLSELERNLDKPPPTCSISSMSPAPAWFHERAKHSTYLLKFAETIDMATGQSVGRVLFDPGDPCMKIAHALPLAHAIAIEDTHNRVITYDADSEKPRARVFGHLMASDPAQVRIAIGKEAGRIVVYDALTGDQRDEFEFPAPLALLRFRRDGRALLAITAEQEMLTVPIR